MPRPFLFIACCTTSTLSRSPVLHWLGRFAPVPVTVKWRERLRAGLGALLGIAVTGAVSHWFLGSASRIPFLIAPMGASAVLLFAVPASPLAQPWSIMGGNLVSALVGVTAARYIADPVGAAAAGIAVAIAAMFMLRCTHPPSGAVALTAVLGGPAVHALGYGFVIEPVAIQSVLLLATALAWHAATGHRYPHAPGPESSGDTTTNAAPAGFSRADLEAVLEQRDELLDIDPADLEALMRETQIRAYARTFGKLTCADVMSGDVVSISPATTVGEARHLLARHDIKALPVVDGRLGVAGIVTRADLSEPSSANPDSCATHLHADADEPVSARMSTHVRTVAAATPVVELVPLFAGRGHHHIPVLDAAQRLAGIVTQADLISGLYRQTQTPAPLP